MDFYKALKLFGYTKEEFNKVNKEDLKTKYRKLSREWHPDFNKDNPEKATKKMQDINKAYVELKKKIEEREKVKNGDPFLTLREIFNKRDAERKQERSESSRQKNNNKKAQSQQHKKAKPKPITFLRHDSSIVEITVLQKVNINGIEMYKYGITEKYNNGLTIQSLTYGQLNKEQIEDFKGKNAEQVIQCLSRKNIHQALMENGGYVMGRAVIERDRLGNHIYKIRENRNIKQICKKYQTSQNIEIQNKNGNTMRILPIENISLGENKSLSTQVYRYTLKCKDPKINNSEIFEKGKFYGHIDFAALQTNPNYYNAVTELLLSDIFAREGKEENIIGELILLDDNIHYYISTYTIQKIMEEMVAEKNSKKQTNNTRKRSAR